MEAVRGWVWIFSGIAHLALTQIQIFQDHRHQVILCYWQLMATK